MVEYARALGAGPLPHPGLGAAAAQVTAVRFAPPTGQGVPVDRSGLDDVLAAACRASRPRWWRRTPGRPGA